MFSYVANKRYEIIKFPEPCPVRQLCMCHKKTCKFYFCLYRFTMQYPNRVYSFHMYREKKIYILSRLNRQKKLSFVVLLKFIPLLKFLR